MDLFIKSYIQIIDQSIVLYQNWGLFIIWLSTGNRALGGHGWPLVALTGPEILLKFANPNFSNRRISVRRSISDNFRIILQGGSYDPPIPRKGESIL